MSHSAHPAATQGKDRLVRLQVNVLGLEQFQRPVCMQPGKGVQVVDAKGSYVMPGGIDPHTHLDAEMFNTVSCDDYAR